ncbi:hypothetical protein ACHAQJ_009407 [Trichoderma viride]
MSSPRAGTRMEPPTPEVRDLGVSVLNKDESDHIYSGLPIGATRLLHLRCGSVSQPIECKLSTTQVSNADFYEALSYVWGPEENLETLFLCGRKFRVTQNLYSALSALRLPDQDRILWIDALCINQSDTAEKGTQIPLMGEIYTNAARVIPWLGWPTDDMEPGLRWLDDLAKSEESKPTDDIKPGFCWLHSLVKSEGFKYYDFPKRCSRSDTRKMFKLIQDSDYWDRAWIVQEVALARDLRLQCGHYSIPYDIFRKAGETDAITFSCTLLTDPSAPDQTIALSPFRHHVISPGSKIASKITVESYLKYLTNKKCVNPQDCVFAFYNLFSPELQEHLPSPRDYCQPLPSLILKTISAMISTENSLYAITIRSCQNEPVEEDAWQLDLPSSCPCVRTPFGFDSLGRLGKVKFFNESVEHSFQNDGKLLRVRGFAMAVVSEVASLHEHRHLVGKDHKAYNDEEIITYHEECVKFGLQILEDVQEDSQEDSEETLFKPGIMTITRETSKSMLANIELPTLLEARRYWQLTKSRKVCKYIVLGDDDDDDDDDNWVNIEDGDEAALIPGTSEMEDIICGIVGCPLPVVLRALPQHAGVETMYKVLGESYIKGLEEYARNAARKSFTLC